MKLLVAILLLPLSGCAVFSQKCVARGSDIIEINTLDIVVGTSSNDTEVKGCGLIERKTRDTGDVGNTFSRMFGGATD